MKELRRRQHKRRMLRRRNEQLLRQSSVNYLLTYAQGRPTLRKARQFYNIINIYQPRANLRAWTRALKLAA